MKHPFYLAAMDSSVDFRCLQLGQLVALAFAAVGCCDTSTCEAFGKPADVELSQGLAGANVSDSESCNDTSCCSCAFVNEELFFISTADRISTAEGACALFRSDPDIVDIAEPRYSASTEPGFYLVCAGGAPSGASRCVSVRVLEGRVTTVNTKANSDLAFIVFEAGERVDSIIVDLTDVLDPSTCAPK